MIDAIYTLENGEGLRALISKLMSRSAHWCVLSPADLKFPCAVEVKDDFGIQSSTLKEMVKIGDVWRRADAPLKSLLEPSQTTKVMVIAV